MAKIPKEGLNLIKEFEGCSLKAYPDPLSGGVPYTIGYGTTRNEQGQPIAPGTIISQEQAEKYLVDECAHHFLPSLKKIPDWNRMNDKQQGALLSFAYNLGADFYGSSDFESITRVLKNKEWDELPAVLMLYVNPGTSVEDGLRRRRKAEGDLWMKGLHNLDDEPEEERIIPEVPSIHHSEQINSATISCVHDTFLKKRPIQSERLKDFEKVACQKGRVYTCKLIEYIGHDHYYVILDYGAGTWYLYSHHWQVD